MAGAVVPAPHIKIFVQNRGGMIIGNTDYRIQTALVGVA